MTERNRAWCWTYYPKNDTIYDEKIFCQEKIKYLIYGVETCPTTGRTHLQGYTVFNDKISRKQAIGFLNFPDTIATNAIKPRYEGSSHEACVAYCRKGDKKNAICIDDGPTPEPEPRKIFEWGAYEQGKRSDIVRAKEMVLAGESMRAITLETTSYQAGKYAEFLMKYHEQPRDWMPNVYWYFGATGSGKSKVAWDEATRDAWPANKTGEWFDGYDGHEKIVIEELRGNWCAFSEMLRLLDRYPCAVYVKGGKRQFKPREIWITSPYAPEDVWDVKENKQQLIRRIKVIKFFNEDGTIEILKDDSTPYQWINPYKPPPNKYKRCPEVATESYS